MLQSRREKKPFVRWACMHNLACNAAAKDAHHLILVPVYQVCRSLLENHCFRYLTVGYYLSEDDDSTFLHMIIPWLIQKLLNPEYCYGVQGQSGKTVQGSLMVLTILSGVKGPVHPDLDQKKWWRINFSVKDPFCCDFADEHKHTVRGGATWVEHQCVRWWVSSLHLQQSITKEFGFYSTCKHLTQHLSTS